MSPFSREDLGNLGHALSTIVQQRYVWLFLHIGRAILLDQFDKERVWPDYYAFSEEDIAAGRPTIQTDLVIKPLLKSFGVFAESEDGSEKYDFNYVREITRTGIRGAFIVSVQAYLEFYRVESIVRNHSKKLAETLLFLRQVRNIFCHSNGDMSSPRLKPCSWKHFKIFRSKQKFKISDYFLLELINEIVGGLSKLLVDSNQKIDFVTLNLGYGVSSIKMIADNLQKG